MKILHKLFLHFKFLLWHSIKSLASGLLLTDTLLDQDELQNPATSVILCTLGQIDALVPDKLVLIRTCV